MKVSDLRPSEYNPRKISSKHVASLKRAMKEFGDLSGIVVNVRSGNVVSGHQRIKTLDPSLHIPKSPCSDKAGTVALGYVDTPSGRWQYREVDWSDKKERAANIAANKHGGEWDYPKLKDLLCDLDTGEIDEATELPYIEHTGFDEAELKSLIDHELSEQDELGGQEEQKEKVCPNCGESL